MSISSRITQIEQHLEDDYSVLEVAGADLTNIDKNIVNLKPTWQERLLYFMDNGTEEVWNNWNKATGEGTSISLNNTLEAKMKIELKGNTYQEGTPTPDTPQEVQTVTGNNEINVEGKNLWSSEWEQGQVDSSGNNATATDRIRTKGYISVIPLQHYAIKRSIGTKFITVRCYDKNKNYLGTGDVGLNLIQGSTATNPMTNGDTTCVIQPKEGVYYLRFNDLTNNLTTQYMLVKGDTPQNYEPYKSQSYEINLGNTELCKIGDYQDFIRKGTGKNLWGNLNTFTYTNSGMTSTQNENGTITIVGTSTGTTPTIRHSQAVDNGIYKTLEPGTYTISSPILSNDIWLQAHSRASSSTPLANAKTPSGASFTLTETTDVIVRFWINASGIKLDGDYIVQLEKSSQSTLYEPYGYKDKWYMYKAIGKVVLDGSEDWYQSGTTAIDKYYTRLAGYTWNSSLDRRGTLCNRFIYHPNTTTIGDMDYSQNNTYFAFFFNYATYNTSTISSFKTWLESNNVIVYFHLPTPTYEEITDSELLSQLEALLGVRSYQGQTNINQENSNLASILNASALQEM